MSDVGAALKKSFDLLNSNRINSSVDTFGMVRVNYKGVCCDKHCGIVASWLICLLTHGTFHAPIME